MRSCRPVHALAADVRAAIGAGGKVLQWSFASAAAVPARAFEADDDGAAGEVDAGGETGDAAKEDVAEDGDSATTAEESAALWPWFDPLPHPTTTIPTATATAAARCAALMRPLPMLPLRLRPGQPVRLLPSWGGKRTRSDSADGALVP
jgi:hypothetical protein